MRCGAGSISKTHALTLFTHSQPPAADEADPAVIDEYHQGRDTLNDCLIKIGICNQRLLQLDQAVTVFTQGKFSSFATCLACR